MSCEEVRDLLDDYVDGELPGSQATLLRGHLDGCGACREEERGLRSLLAEAATLPRELRPARELWPGIEPHLRPKVVAFAARRRSWLGGALAAAAAVLVALSSFSTWRTGQPGHETSTRAVSLTVPSGTTGALRTASARDGAAGMHECEREYARAATDLLAAIDARRATLPPETLRAIDRNMQLIDQALASLRAAIESASDNQDLEQLLAATHKRKLDTLRRLARLSKI